MKFYHWIMVTFRSAAEDPERPIIAEHRFEPISLQFKINMLAVMNRNKKILLMSFSNTQWLIDKNINIIVEAKTLSVLLGSNMVTPFIYSYFTCSRAKFWE